MKKIVRAIIGLVVLCVILYFLQKADLSDDQSISLPMMDVAVQSAPDSPVVMTTTAPSIIGVKIVARRPTAKESFPENCTDDFVSNETSNKQKRGRGPYVVLMIFCGRRAQMSVLLRYLLRLIEMGEVAEIHFCLHKRSSFQDQDWIKFLSGAHKSFFIHTMASYPEAYDFFAKRWTPPQPKLSKRTLIVKFDDDVVYVGLEKFHDFVNYTMQHPEMFLVHANIVNNGVAAFYQQRQGLIPWHMNGVKMVMEYPKLGLQGSLVMKPEKGRELHKLFLSNTSRFSWMTTENDGCIAYRPPGNAHQQRFSINCFATRYSNMPELAERVRRVGNDDEEALTTRNPRSSCIYTPFNVAHLGFRTQKGIAGDILPLYEKEADKQCLGTRVMTMFSNDLF